jgi:hypothetical protein
MGHPIVFGCYKVGHAAYIRNDRDDLAATRMRLSYEIRDLSGKSGLDEII